MLKNAKMVPLSDCTKRDHTVLENLGNLFTLNTSLSNLVYFKERQLRLQAEKVKTCTKYPNHSPIFLRTTQPLSSAFFFHIRSVSLPRELTIAGSLSNDDGNANENVTLKYNKIKFIPFLPLPVYFNSFYGNGEVPRNQIDRSGVQIKKENEKLTVVCSRSPQNLEFGHITFLFCGGRQRNVECTRRAIVFTHF